VLYNRVVFGGGFERRACIACRCVAYFHIKRLNLKNMSSFSEYNLRTATIDDEKNIKGLIRRVHINPMGINWERFIVAESLNLEFIGCGQIKRHFDGSSELASLAVEEKYRNKGIASAIIRKLLSESNRPLFLMCRKELGTYYTKFGFTVIKEYEYPPYFQRITRVIKIVTSLVKHGEPLIMRLDK
jgi:N-acetylglutamate synthase-like GNAT family acetyltransferase